MINKEDYLRKKGLLPKENYGVLYCFKSDRSGVTDIKEVLIWEKYIQKNAGHRGSFSSIGIDITNYKMEETPYEVSIWADEKFSEHRGIGSGYGDLWSWSWFSSEDKSVLEEERAKELKRVTEKYILEQLKTK